MSVNKIRFHGLVLAAIIAATLGICGAAPAAEQSLAGNWVFQGQAGLAPAQGAQPSSMTDGMVIHQDGGKINGTLTVPRGGSCPFEGTITGNDVHFVVKRQTPEGEVDVEYKGTVDGNSMKGTSRVVGQATGTDIHWAANRQN